jgi:hypothetical protein
MFGSAYIYNEFLSCLGQNGTYISSRSLLIIFKSQSQSFPDPAEPISLLVIQNSDKEKNHSYLSFAHFLQRALH